MGGRGRPAGNWQLPAARPALKTRKDSQAIAWLSFFSVFFSVWVGPGGELRFRFCTGVSAAPIPGRRGSAPLRRPHTGAAVSQETSWEILEANRSTPSSALSP